MTKHIDDSAPFDAMDPPEELLDWLWSVESLEPLCRDTDCTQPCIDEWPGDPGDEEHEALEDLAKLQLREEQDHWEREAQERQDEEDDYARYVSKFAEYEELHWAIQEHEGWEEMQAVLRYRPGHFFY